MQPKRYEDTQLFARFHPDSPRKTHTTAGITFARGQGPYKGWYPVSKDQADKLRQIPLVEGNPNSGRAFQVEAKSMVDDITAHEARVRMTPEQARITAAHDVELRRVQNELAEMKGALSGLTQVLGMGSDPKAMQRMTAMFKAMRGEPLGDEELRILDSIATAPPRRGPMDDRELDDDHEPTSVPPGEQGSAPTGAMGPRPGAAQPGDAAKDQAAVTAPPPPARPGAARQGGGKGQQRQGGNQQPGAARPGTPAHAAPVPPDSPALAMMQAAIDEEEGDK